MNNTNLKTPNRNLPRSPSTAQVRDKIRQRFRHSLENARRKSIDSRRFSSEQICSNPPQSHIKCAADLHKLITNNGELSSLITADDVMRILEEVKSEHQSENEEKLSLYEAEINSILNSILETCMICDQVSDSPICLSCAQDHFSDGL